VGYEFRSRQRVLGLPLLHVVWGVDPFTGRSRVARGVIAVGPVALGAVAIGPVAVGVLAVGQISCGAVFAAGQLAAAVFGLGQVALGKAHAWGQIALAQTADGSDVVVADAHAWLVLGTVWMAVALGFARSWWQRRRPLRRLAAPMTVGQAPAGLAVVRGRVVSCKTVEAPVSHRAVVAYDVSRIRDREPAQTERRCVDFFIEDESGRARILANHVELVLEPSGRVMEAAMTRVVASEAAGGSVGAGIVETVGIMFERVLLPGDEVVVAGHALRSVDVGARVTLALHGGATGPVLVTNRDVSELCAEAALALWLAVLLSLAALVAPLVL
jgi:hypothetical protein